MTIHSKTPIQKLTRENLRRARLWWPMAIDTMTIERLSRPTRSSLPSLSPVVIWFSWIEVGTSPIRDSCAWLAAKDAGGFTSIQSKTSLTKALLVSLSKPRFIRSTRLEASLGMATPIPPTVSPMVRGAEMRIAETRAVNRALRKAYGIGLCSVEELGSSARSEHESTGPGKLPPQPAGGSGRNGREVRDQLCQTHPPAHSSIPNLVKAYAVDFCGTTALKDATREQVENLRQAALPTAAKKDRDALLCQLNSYARATPGGGCDETPVFPESPRPRVIRIPNVSRWRCSSCALENRAQHRWQCTEARSMLLRLSDYRTPTVCRPLDRPAASTAQPKAMWKLGCRQLRKTVLERDRWRCQVCGTMSHLEVHHLNLRSRSGDDTDKNLITLCAECHAACHAS